MKRKKIILTSIIFFNFFSCNNVKNISKQKENIIQSGTISIPNDSIKKESENPKIVPFSLPSPLVVDFTKTPKKNLQMEKSKIDEILKKDSILDKNTNMDIEKNNYYMNLSENESDNSKKLNYAQKALEYNINDYRAYNSIGLVFLNLEKYDKAEAYLLKSFEINNKYVDVLYNLFILYYYKLKSYETSKIYLDKLKEIEPNFFKKYNMDGNFDFLYENLEKEIAFSYYSFYSMWFTKKEIFEGTIYCIDNTINKETFDILFNYLLKMNFKNNIDLTSYEQSYQYIGGKILYSLKEKNDDKFKAYKKYQREINLLDAFNIATLYLRDVHRKNCRFTNEFEYADNELTQIK
ncbi:MAG: hypothetical protein U0457_02910 [Candidatus Sericytochromatia bacterium]